MRTVWNDHRIPRGEVHLWWAPLALSDREVARARTCLDTAEQQRADRFRIESKARRFIIARAVLRQLLGRVTGTDPLKVKFRIGAHGKPYMSEPGPFFNASDSGDTVVVALATDEIGVDVEVARRLDRHRRLARRISTDRELEELARLPEDRRNAAVLRLWTCKEAALKAAGTGLAGGLRNVEFSGFGTNAPEVTDLLGEADGWAVLFPDLVPHLLCTVVAKNGTERAVGRRFELSPP